MMYKHYKKCQASKNVTEGKKTKTFVLFFCTSLSFAGNSGGCHLTWIRHSSRKSSKTHSFQCVRYFRVSIRWSGCQCLWFLTCAHMLMQAIAHGGCTDTLGESALEVDSVRKSLAASATRTHNWIIPALYRAVIYQGKGSGIFHKLQWNTKPNRNQTKRCHRNCNINLFIVNNFFPFWRSFLKTVSGKRLSCAKMLFSKTLFHTRIGEKTEFKQDVVHHSMSWCRKLCQSHHMTPKRQGKC